MFLACRASGNVADCGGTAVSSGYPSAPIPEHIMERLGWEWYRPGVLERLAMSSEMQDHISRGGLALRALGIREETDE